LSHLAAKFLNASARLVPITEEEDFLPRGYRTVITTLAGRSVRVAAVDT
jgi:hypothetical protein